MPPANEQISKLAVVRQPHSPPVINNNELALIPVDRLLILHPQNKIHEVIIFGLPPEETNWARHSGSRDYEGANRYK